MRKLDLRLLPLAVVLVATGCFTPANYGEGVKDSKGHGHEGAPAGDHAGQAEGAEHAAEGAEPEVIVEGILPGTEPRKLDMDTPRIEFEPPFNGKPKTSNKLPTGVLVEDFEAGSGPGVVEGQIVEFHFKGYSASSNRQVMGSRIAPMRLLLNKASRERDPMTNAMIDAVLGAKAGGKRRVKVPSSIVDKDAKGRPPMGDMWICLDIVKVEERPTLQPAESYTGEPIATKKHSNGLQTFDYFAGEGREAKLGDRVVVHYIGRLDDGTVFDQSHDRADGLNVILGAGGIIEGMAQGLDGVRVGMRRKIVIPPEIGYGPQANGPIPANSTLTFLVEVLVVEDGPPIAAPGMPGPPPGVGPGGAPPPPPPAPKPAAPPVEPG
jgi:FKBP-type peptidyl-prolyl cis-trans isomerase